MLVRMKTILVVAQQLSRHSLVLFRQPILCDTLVATSLFTSQFDLCAPWNLSTSFNTTKHEFEQVANFAMKYAYGFPEKMSCLFLMGG